jgi:flagellum-specific peptidoglycan hydrolase FlgJ
MRNAHLPVVVQQALKSGWNKSKEVSKRPMVRIAFFALCIYLFDRLEISVQFSLGGGARPTGALVSAAPVQEPDFNFPGNTPVSPLTTTVPMPSGKSDKPNALAQKVEVDKAWWRTIRDESGNIERQLNLANAATAVGAALSPEEQAQAAKYSNLVFVLNPDFAKKHKIDPKIVATKQQIVYNYIKKYAKIAQEEARLFNIPASITLAQGLLESNAGESLLASKDNNHFGIKCQSKCLGCRCANYTDDSKYDMFRVFDSAWQSFREHSKLLNGNRYKHLQKIKAENYQAWAMGLKEAGYATDPRYGEKLIQIIEILKLYKYDQ